MRAMRPTITASLLLASTILASPAIAGDDVLYAPAPEWVEQVELDSAEVAEGPSAVLYDWQYRLEGGTEHAFTDMAFRLDNPEALMQAGTLSFSWLPDNGDLTVHRLEILRGDEVIDLLAQGVTFDVLRREQALEQRFIDGELTASLAVPGLREDDVLRVAFSTSNDERAFGGEVQSLQFLPSDPWRVGFSRVKVSWPSDEEMFFDAGERVELPALTQSDGYNWLEVSLPLDERDPVPADAPYRFQQPDVLRVGSFASWQEVSSVMAPHFEAASTVPDNSEVAQLADDILAQTDDPLEKMALAVRLVQDEVSYLFVGLDGGGYMPQSALETWDKRYGDCKAKSVLLHALLKRIGIQSEVVLVDTQRGNAAPTWLPLPAFDHMIVHAVVDGTDYWLDGTMNGTRLATLGDVPNFYYALPLREEGSDLMPITPRDSAVPQMAMAMAVDQSAGVDFPGLFEMTMTMQGPAGVRLQAMVDEDNPQALRQWAKQFSASDSDMIVSDLAIEYDEEAAIGVVRITGVMPTSFEWRDGRLRAESSSFDQEFNFNPDRARRAWREIPVATPGPARTLTELTLTLPDGGEGYTLEGEPTIEGGFANTRLVGSARIDDGRMISRSELFMQPGEIAAADVPQAKRDARRLLGSNLELVPPEDVTWRWELGEEERAARAAPILAAYDKAVRFADADDFTPLQWRAYFNMSIYDFDAALMDLDRLIDEAPDTWSYYQRHLAHRALGHEDQAIADLEASYDLNPNSGTAQELARRLAYNGRPGEALDLMDSLPVSDEDRIAHADVMAEVLALDGEVEQGFALLEDLVADQPQNSGALNGDCWFRGLFSYALDTAMERCTQAVERAGNPSAALDSRALIHFRQGQYAAAIADLDTVLDLVPGMPESLYLRGVVRLHAGDNNGRSDIADALTMAPYLPGFYAKHGIMPPE